MSDSQYTEDSSIQAGQDVASTDNPSTDYESRQGQKDYIPVQSDSKDVEDPINPDTADSDETLGKSSRFPPCFPIFNTLPSMWLSTTEEESINANSQHSCR